MPSPSANRRVLPGFRLTLAFTLAYLLAIVLIPLSSLFTKTATLTWAEFVAKVTSARALSAYELTFGAALVGALVNACFGSIVRDPRRVGQPLARIRSFTLVGTPSTNPAGSSRCQRTCDWRAACRALSPSTTQKAL